MKLIELSDSREKIFSLLGKSLDEVRRDVKILREWIDKQPHLPSHLIGDEIMETLLIRSNFYVEKVKSRLEDYSEAKGIFTSRLKYLYEKSFPQPYKASYNVTIPKLTDNFERIIITNYRSEEEFDMMLETLYALTMREILLRHDYNCGEIYILDARILTPSMLSKVRLNLFAEFVPAFMKAYFPKNKGIHIIMPYGMNLFKGLISIVRSQLKSQIIFHKDHESLKEYIDTKYLPSDFGGELQSLEELRAEWEKIYEDNQEILLKYIDTKSNDDKKLETPRFEQMNGTFRKMEID